MERDREKLKPWVLIDPRQDRDYDRVRGDFATKREALAEAKLLNDYLDAENPSAPHFVVARVLE